MIRALLRLTVLTLLSVFVGCSASAVEGPNGTRTTRMQVVIDTDPFDVPPGAEILMCTVTDQVLDEDFDVVTVHSYQQKGGHHAAFFYSTEPIAPAATHLCLEHETMKWQFIGAGAEGEELGLALPPGVAIRVPKGARIVVESHYINPSKDVHHVRDRVTAEAAADPKTITAHADVFQVTDFEMHIPPHVSQTRRIECTLDGDLTALDLNGHAHQWATSVRVSVVRAGKTEREMLYDQPWEPQFQFIPPTTMYPADALPVFRKGDRVSVECNWRNTTDRTLSFPSEMCIGTMHYIPGRGYLKCGVAVETTTDPLPSP